MCKHPWVRIRPFPLGLYPQIVHYFFKMNSQLEQIESILEDVDALIGSFLDVGEDENARALVEEFKEWFLDYDMGREVKVLTIKTLR